MNTISLLEQLGFSKNEATLYLGLVDSGPITIAEIAKKTGLHRPIVYKTLPLLQSRGLVISTKKGARTLFIAENPEKLETLLNETEAVFYNLMSELKAKYKSKENRPIVKLLEGKKGITSVFDDLVKTLRRGDIFYRYSSARESRDEYLPKNYRKISEGKKLERFVITNKIQASQKEPRMDRAMKVIPDEYALFDRPRNEDNHQKYSLFHTCKIQ